MFYVGPQMAHGSLFEPTDKECQLGRFTHNFCRSFAERFNRISLLYQVASEKQRLFCFIPLLEKVLQ